jgi:RNA recognition motif-containing protein
VCYITINKKEMNIYVSQLSYSTTSESLQELFEKYGEVTSAKIINDRESGRSRGFGFVDMSNDEEGQKAIDELNGTDFEGKTINVCVARPRQERSNGGGRFGNNRGGGYNRRY